MENLVSNQFHIFLTSIYGGILIAFIYDLYRISRYYFKPKKIATIIQDMIFWIVILMTTLILLYYSNWAELRWYIFLGFIIGFFLYNRLLSKIVIKILVYIGEKIIKLTNKVMYIITYPIRIIVNFLKIPGKKVLNRGEMGYKRVKKYCRIPILVTRDYKKQIKKLIKKK